MSKRRNYTTEIYIIKQIKKKPKTETTKKKEIKIKTNKTCKNKKKKTLKTYFIHKKK